ncbi:MAG: pyridoxamine 5'-phosphate oxidase family protein [Azoarcus sp.]|jgi:general stress protein 26|nr:pyridoxamine 5'-phosphate oxidase family protein [Azoarcus sp.]
MRNLEKTLGALIDQLNMSIVGSVDEDGFPNAKALLQPRRRDGIKTFWFATNTSSMRVAQFRANPRACLYFFDRRACKGVMLRGNMAVLEDDATKEMLWKEGDIRHYHKGMTDPDYCVLRFTTVSGRYYVEFSSRDFTVP